MTPPKLVILDRDGVINHDSDAFIKSPNEWHPIEGALEAISSLHHNNWKIVVVTNQSGVGRGLFDMVTLGAIHTKMIHAVQAAGGRIDAIFFCPHTSNDHCTCRKPRPGMLLEVADRFNVDLHKVPLVGDSLRDLEAAAAVGAQPYLVKTGKGQQTLEKGGLPERTQVFDSLHAVVNSLLNQC